MCCYLIRQASDGQSKVIRDPVVMIADCGNPWDPQKLVCRTR